MRKRILATIVAVATLAVLALFVPAAASVRDHIERGELLALQREASIVARRVPPVGAIDLAELSQIVEDEYGVKFNSSDVENLKTVGDAIDYIVAKS